jgi:hypothetical protein
MIVCRDVRSSDKGWARISGFKCRSGCRLEQGRLNASGAAQPPQYACQPQYQLALDCRFRIIIRNYGGFEGLVVLCILERGNDGLCSEAMTDGIAARTLFAFRRDRPGALERVAPVGCDLLKRSH